MNKLLKGAALAAVAVVGTVSMSGSTGLVQAATEVNSKVYQTQLTQLNSSGDSGTATVRMVDDNTVTVSVNTTGVSPNLPHAQHLHIGGQGVCPAPSASGDDKFLTSAEGVPSYGEVRVSLTTTGAVDAKSGLAVDRFPVANAQGVINYERTFDLPAGTTMEEVSTAVVVQHGISELFGDKAKYDGDMKSSLDPKLPLEATIPASCGALTAAPVGGAGAGAGSTSGIENQAAFVVAALSLGAAVVLLGGRSLTAKRQ